MAETRTRLAELCRDHRIDIELVERSQDLDQVLDRTLEACARQVAGGAQRANVKLAGLVKLAVETRALQSRGADLDGTERELARVERELTDAQSRAERLQRQLDDTMAELDPDAARPTVAVDIELLGELLGSLSRLCHKINNPLTSILGRAQMLQLKVKQGLGDEKLRKSVQVIEESAKRVANLIQELANLVCQGRKEFVEHYDSSSGSR